jgi:4-hydroxy-3-methylbut-2-enyl diphosphate reductase
VIGTFGQVPEGSMTLIETVEDAEAVTPPDPENLAFLTQTTLSVDDTAAVLASLKARFPTMLAPGADDICYATSNRQNAVKAISQNCDLVLVIGAPNSSNSLRLVEVAKRHGKPSYLVQGAHELDFAWFDGVRTVGITAGASAPEVLVRELVERIAERFDVTEREVETVEENIVFKLPRGLEAA